MFDTLIVAPPLTLTVLPAFHRDSVAQGAAAHPDSATVTLTGQGNATAVWTPTHRAAATWVTLGPGGTGSGKLRWTRNATGLAQGFYIDTITVSASGAQGSPAKVIDTLIVASPLTLTVLPAFHRDSVAQGAAAHPDSATVTLTGQGNATAVWTPTHRATATWLTLGPGGTGSGKLRWTRSATGLAQGFYIDTITVSASGAQGSPAKLIDTLIIGPSPVTPTAAIAAALRDAPLDTAQVRYLDDLGNHNAGFDVGDFLAYCRTFGCPASSDAATAVMISSGDSNPALQPVPAPKVVLPARRRRPSQ